MIVKGSQRSGGRALAAHLLNLRDNDHVEIHRIDGLISPDVTGAFIEIEAISRATRCKQPFFSVSISPPKGETVVNADFENAIAEVAETMGLAQQPRVIIFHEKEARRHCHVVFSRIDPMQLKAINLPFFKRRLTEISRELYLSHGFDMPGGLADRSLTDPLNFSLEEWQVAKRAKRDPREIKVALKQCWAQSDSLKGFDAALKERGFWLCRGDQRGFVAIDYHGNVYSLSRWLGVGPKALKARIGDADRLVDIAKAKAKLEEVMSEVTRRLKADLDRKHAEAMQPLLAQRLRMVERQRHERATLAAAQLSRHQTRLLAQAQRFRSGIKGLWDWVTGRRRNINRAIESEMQRAKALEKLELHKLRVSHLEERRVLQTAVALQRLQAQSRIQELNTHFPAAVSTLNSAETAQTNLRTVAIDMEEHTM